MAPLLHGLRLGAVVALLLWVVPTAFAQAGLAFWASVVWSAGLWRHARVAVGSTAVSVLVAAAVVAAAGLADWWVLLPMVVGVTLGRARLRPLADAEGDDAASWARANRDEYVGQGSGVAPRAVGLTNDPYGGLLGAAPVVRSHRDPYEDALTVPVREEEA